MVIAKALRGFERCTQGKRYSGCSIGAFIGAAAATNTLTELAAVEPRDPTWLQRTAIKTGVVWNALTNHDGTFDHEPLVQPMLKAIEKGTKQSAQVHVYCGVCRDNKQEEKEILLQNKGKVTPNDKKMLLASSAIPGVFRPVVIEDIKYEDGGEISSFPQDAIDAFISNAEDGPTMLFLCNCAPWVIDFNLQALTQFPTHHNGATHGVQAIMARNTQCGYAWDIACMERKLNVTFPSQLEGDPIRQKLSTGVCALDIDKMEVLTSLKETDGAQRVVVFIGPSIDDFWGYKDITFMQATKEQKQAMYTCATNIRKHLENLGL